MIVDGAIRRPNAPNHFMVLKPITRRIVIKLPDGTVLCDSCNAIRLLEAGKSLYDPVIYLPRADCCDGLTKQEKTTHCPLKGDASYFSYDHNGYTIEDLAWSYDHPFDFSQEIAGMIAFYANKVIVEEHPSGD